MMPSPSLMWSLSQTAITVDSGSCMFDEIDSSTALKENNHNQWLNQASWLMMLCLCLTIYFLSTGCWTSKSIEDIYWAALLEEVLQYRGPKHIDPATIFPPTPGNFEPTHLLERAYIIWFITCNAWWIIFNMYTFTWSNVDKKLTETSLTIKEVFNEVKIWSEL